MKKIICYISVVLITIGLNQNLFASINSFSLNYCSALNTRSDFPEYENYLSGKKLTRVKGATGNDYGRLNSYSSTEIYINANHTFVYKHTSESFSSDVTLYSNEDVSRGYWEIISYNNRPIVYIQYEDGTELYLEIKIANGIVYLGDEKYLIE